MNDIEILEKLIRQENFIDYEEYQVEIDTAIENLLKERQADKDRIKELDEYKKIAELTKISCCTAQNCEALNNAIKEGLENQKLKVELDKKDKIINEMAEIIEECRQNDCLESDEIDLSEIAGKDRIIDYFTKKVTKED